MEYARKIALYHNEPQERTKKGHFIYLVLRIELTRAILINVLTIKFSEKFDNLFLHVFFYLVTFPESCGFVAMAVANCIKYVFKFIPIQLVNGDEIVRPL